MEHVLVHGASTGRADRRLPTRLVIETPVARPPYNAVMRFYDEGDQPLRDQATALLAPMARSLYQRMGYEDIATFEVWAAPDTVHL